MRIASTVLFACLTAVAAAQTVSVHGRVDGVSGTHPQRFELRCTGIPMQSTTLDLNELQGEFQRFQVVDIGTPGAPVLDVRSATRLDANFDMGNLRIGESNRWTVSAPAGSFALIAVNAVDATGFQPFPGTGTWLLGSNAVTLAVGMATSGNRFEIRVSVPQTALPLVGTAFAGQGLVVAQGQATFTNAECKAIEAR